MKKVALGAVIAIAVIAMIIVFGVEPAPVDAAPSAANVTLDVEVERHDLRFPCGETKCAAWLYLPTSVERPPIVVMGHGFAGTRDVGLPYFAERFARAGIAALVFDYRNFGSSGGSPRQLINPWMQLEDWRAVITFARSRSDLDVQRLALFGSSLGGGLALVCAADDKAVRAVVALAPQIDSDSEGEATFPGIWWAIKLVVLGWGDLLSERLGGEALTLPALGPTDSWAMLPDDAAQVAFDKLVQPGSTYRNEVVAHSVFTFDDYNPARRTSDIAAPVLLVASRKDRFAPFSAVQSFADSAKAATLVEYDGDHFDIYSPPAAEEAANKSIAFLLASFGPGHSASAEEKPTVP
jgi:pimeloyl-ACP methyl ester carboxylesterase